MINTNLNAVTAACIVVSLAAARAHAGVLVPGETRDGVNERHEVWPLPDPSAWQGELLAERTQEYEFTGLTTENEQVAHRGTLTSRVHRDRGTGGLAFVYDFDFVQDSPPGLAVDFESARIRDFGGFATDVYFSREDFVVTRSADGTALDFGFNIGNVDGTFLSAPTRPHSTGTGPSSSPWTSKETSKAPAARTATLSPRSARSLSPRASAPCACRTVSRCCPGRVAGESAPDRRGPPGCFQR